MPGNFRSRKLAFSAFAILMLLAGGIMAAKWPSFAPLYGTFVGGVVAISAAYLTGNVASAWVGQKQSEPEEEPK